MVAQAAVVKQALQLVAELETLHVGEIPELPDLLLQLDEGPLAPALAPADEAPRLPRDARVVPALFGESPGALIESAGDDLPDGGEEVPF